MEVEINALKDRVHGITCHTGSMYVLPIVSSENMVHLIGQLQGEIEGKKEII